MANCSSCKGLGKIDSGWKNGTNKVPCPTCKGSGKDIDYGYWKGKTNKNSLSNSF